MKVHLLRGPLWTLFGLIPLVAGLLASQPAAAQERTCLDDVTGRTNDCVSTDVQIGVLLNDEDASCMPGDPVTLNLTARLLATSLERYDIGLFLALDGGDARTGACRQSYLPPPLAAGGACSGSGAACKKDADCPLGETCTGGYNPGSTDSAGGPFYDAEPEDAADECGDLEPGVNTYLLLPPVTVECTDSDGDGYLDIGTAVSWDGEANNTCENLDDAIPITAGNCLYATVDVVNVIALPGQVRVQKSAQPEQLLEPGGRVTFSIVVENVSPLTVTVEGLDDSVYGPLQQWADGNCAVPQTLSAGEAYTCTISAEVTGDPGIHEDIVTAWGTAWDKAPAWGFDTAEVRIVAQPPETGVGMPATVVVGGMATAGLGLVLAGALVRRRTT